MTRSVVGSSPLRNFLFAAVGCCALLALLASGRAQDTKPATAAAAAAKGTVLVTGANRGIGLELAKQYRAQGYDVIGTARSPEEATVLLREFEPDLPRRLQNCGRLERG
jgi:NADPH:quinone reductase-like Zn-dependent oxidoreductase